MMNMRSSIEIPLDIKEQYPKCYALEVFGDYMAPQILEGDRVIVDPASKPRGNGQEIAVLMVQGKRFICKYIRVAGQIVMLFDNAGYASTTFPERAVLIVGKVVFNADANKKTPCSAANRQDVPALV